MKVGDTVTVTRLLTAADVEAFAQLSLDRNPLHVDPAFGRASFFGQNVAHGLLGAALVSGALTALCGSGNLWLSTEISFREPLAIGAEIECRATLKRIERRREAHIEFEVRQANEVAIAGTARCLVPYAGLQARL